MVWYSRIKTVVGFLSSLYLSSHSFAYCSKVISESLADLEIETIKELDRLIKLKEEISVFLNRLDSPYREVLNYRYVQCMIWDDIAEVMSYSRIGVLKIHKRGLKKCILFYTM